MNGKPLYITLKKDYINPRTFFLKESPYHLVNLNNHIGRFVKDGRGCLFSFFFFLEELDENKIEYEVVYSIDSSRFANFDY